MKTIHLDVQRPNWMKVRSILEGYERRSSTGFNWQQREHTFYITGNPGTIYRLLRVLTRTPGKAASRTLARRV
jgi:hypothetical protein